MTDQQVPETPGASGTARIWFWWVAAFGLFASAFSWAWYGFAQLEAQPEQGKALAAGTTMAGFAEVVGGVPLVLAHVGGRVLLGGLGWGGYRGRGVVLAFVAVLIASGIGIGLAQWLYDGGLFQLGIDNDVYMP